MRTKDSDNILQRNQAGNLLTKSSHKHHLLLILLLLLLLLPPPPSSSSSSCSLTPPHPTIAYLSLSLICYCWLLIASLAALIVVVVVVALVVVDVIISFVQRTHVKVSGGGVSSFLQAVAGPLLYMMSKPPGI